MKATQEYWASEPVRLQSAGIQGIAAAIQGTVAETQAKLAEISKDMKDMWETKARLM